MYKTLAMSIFLTQIINVAAAQQAKGNPLRSSKAILISESVTYDAQSRIVGGMIEVNGERTMILTGATFCASGSGILSTANGRFQENVLSSGDKKQDQLFRELCSEGRIKIRTAEIQREIDERARQESMRQRQQQERDDALRRQQQERDSAFLRREAECFAFPERCR